MKLYTLIAIFTLLSSSLIAQISSGGTPKSWLLNDNNNAKTITLETSQYGSYNLKHNKNEGFKFAESIELNIDIKEQGSRFETDKGSFWKINIHSPKAYSLNIIFKQFIVPQKAELFIYNPNYYLLGAFTSKNCKKHGGLATSPVSGDFITVEYFEPKNAAFSGKVVIGNIGHDFTGVFVKEGQFGASDDCNIDINCEQGNEWQKEKRSVCRMIIEGTTLCTGTLLNNSLQDKTPYVLSANHCVNNNYSAQNTIFLFNYESAICNGSDGSTAQSVSGAELIATKNNDSGYLDFTLLKLSQDIPLSFKPYFAGWDTRNNTSEKTVGIHHPMGDVKKISTNSTPVLAASYSPYDENTFWQIDKWESGTTEGGSSGSPLFDKNHRIIGTLTGDDGDPNDCDNPVNDFYQMFSASFNKYTNSDKQLQRWLDPENKGITHLNGFDPINDNISDKIVVAHWKANQELAFYEADAGGYISGNNAFGDLAKAEFFAEEELKGRDFVIGAYIAFAYATGNDNEQVELQILSDSSGTPNSLKGSSYASLKEIKEKADKDYVYYSFDPPLKISGSMFLSLVLPQTPGDTVALINVKNAQTNTAWELNINNSWSEYSNPNSPWNIKSAHLIAIEVGNATNMEAQPTTKKSFNLYPNPAKDYFIVESNSVFDLLEIFDIYGRKIKTVSSINQKLYQLNTSEFTKGFYLVVIRKKNESITKQLIIE